MTPEYTFIYTLCDPRTGQVRYVGKANNPARRFMEHLEQKEKGGTARSRWILELSDIGLKPIMRIVMKVPFDRWQRFEQNLIAIYREQGAGLFNIHKGGGSGGHWGHWSDAGKAMLSEKAKARWRDPEYKDRCTIAMKKGQENNPGFRSIISQKAKRRYSDPSYKARVAESTRKSHNTQEFKDKVSERTKSNWDNEEFREKVSSAVKKHHSDPEWRRQQGEIHKETVTDESREQARERTIQFFSDPENRKRQSEIAKGFWDDPEYVEKTKNAMRASWTPERRKRQAEMLRERNIKRGRKHND